VRRGALGDGGVGPGWLRQSGRGFVTANMIRSRGYSGWLPPVTAHATRIGEDAAHGAVATRSGSDRACTGHALQRALARARRRRDGAEAGADGGALSGRARRAEPEADGRAEVTGEAGGAFTAAIRRAPAVPAGHLTAK